MVNGHAYKASRKSTKEAPKAQQAYKQIPNTPHRIAVRRRRFEAVNSFIDVHWTERVIHNNVQNTICR